MHKKLGCVLALATICWTAGFSQAAGSTSPGKSSVYGSVEDVALTLPASEVTGEILKGKKKTVVEIDVTVLVQISPTDNLFQTNVMVNGVFPEPLDTQYFHCARAVCTVHGHYWLDIDAAELEYPGEFVGQSLEIVAMASSLNPASGDVSLRAKVVKK